MHLNRRSLLASAATLPLLAACATDLSKDRERPVAELAQDLGVCSATSAVVRAGVAQPPMALSGCGESIRPDAIFQAASLTKPVFAFGVLRLVLDGQLELGSAVSRYLPNGYKHYRSVLARSAGDPHDIVPATALSAVPVATLLNHTSGFPNWASGTLSRNFEPGLRWQYSGEGYLVLHAVVETITGMDLSSYFDRQVFAPLSMHDTSLVWQASFGDRVQRGTGVGRDVRFTAPVAAASLYTTASDYARFMSALLIDDPIASLTISRPVEVDRRLGLAWGLGWGIEHGAGSPCIWQWGNNPGYRSFAMASLGSKDGFVILTNSDRGMPLAASVAHATLPEQHNAFRFPMVR